MGKTHIEITEEARDELRVWKAKRGMTYNEAIRDLLQHVKSSDKPNDERQQ